MKVLKRKDFKTYYGDIYYFYRFTKNSRRFELCLEPCFRGFCIALYEKIDDQRTQVLAVPRKCTGEYEYLRDLFVLALGGYKERQPKTWTNALKIANKIVKVYFKKS